MIAQVWECKVFGNKNNKEKHLGKSQDRCWNKDQKPIPNTLFFFNFFNPLKQIKNELLNPKTLLKLVAKTLKMRIFALEILVKSTKEGAIYNPPKILPVGSQERAALPVDRPVDRHNGHIYLKPIELRFSLMAPSQTLSFRPSLLSLLLSASPLPLPLTAVTAVGQFFTDRWRYTSI